MAAAASTGLARALLSNHGVRLVYHCAPLHYLPFIARSRAVLSKPSLQKAGFGPSHLRPMSRDLDVERGFGSYAHLTLDDGPESLKSKVEGRISSYRDRRARS